ncbi:MAG TPA: metallophosphoesterase [Gemmatimonadaceae bacterium]
MRTASPLVLACALLVAACGGTEPVAAPRIVSSNQLAPSAERSGDNNGATTSEDDNGSGAFSFVVVGCNRVDTPDTNKAVNPSTANLEQLRRTFAEVAAMRPRPKFLFLAGDIVFGYTNSQPELKAELLGWRAVYEASPLAGSDVRLVPIPGNHEVQNKSKVATLAAEQTWLEVMGPYIAPFGGNGPHAGGADGLATDQSSLSYSFDYKGTHFLLLDSDPVGRDWSVPTKWVASDLRDARRRGARHIFAIAHKPAYGYPASQYRPANAVGDDLGKVLPALRDDFWHSLIDNHAEAMLAAHDHLYSRARGAFGQTWQIIAGNGGSRLESVVDEASINFYGYTVVRVEGDGRAMLTSYGRDVPAAGYLTSSSAYPTTVRDRADISWR